MKTIAIYGLPVKRGDKAGRGARNYQDPDDMPEPGEPTFVYHCSDEVSSDDVMFYIETSGYRIAPVDADGNRIKTTIGIDTTKRKEKGMKLLGRTSLSKAIKKDMQTIDWKKPSDNHHIGENKDTVWEQRRDDKANKRRQKGK